MEREKEGEQKSGNVEGMNVIDFCLWIVTALNEYIVFANRRTYISDSHRRTDIHNSNIDRDTKNNMFMRTIRGLLRRLGFSEWPGIAT